MHKDTSWPGHIVVAEEAEFPMLHRAVDTSFGWRSSTDGVAKNNMAR
jgi:hypothetical protein